MQIPSHPKYDVDLDGTVVLISTGDLIEEKRNRSGRRCVIIRGPNHKLTSQPLDRVMLRTFKPLPSNVDENWLSVRFIDGDKDNLQISNLEWDDTWYQPTVVPGVTHSLDGWFSILGYPDLELSFLNGLRLRNIRTGNLYTLSVENNGYLCARVPVIGLATIHRLIALTFLAHPLDTDHLTVNHKDSNKTNNVLTNLEWATYSRNINHSFIEGVRDEEQRRVCLMSMEDNIVSYYPSLNAAARFLGSNVGMIHSLCTNRQRRGLGYKGFLIKFEDDPISWDEMKLDVDKNQEAYCIAVKDMHTGEVRVHHSLMQTMKAEGIYPLTIYRLLWNELIVPWRGRCFQTYKEDGMTWPNYPPEIVDVFSRVMGKGRPFKVVYPDGTVEYSAGVTEWCNADRTNRCDPAVLSRLINKRGEWRGMVFEYLDLKDYQ